MTYWLFQGNPKYYRLQDTIHDCEQIPWLVTRYANQIAVGDGVLIWHTGTKAGVYASAEIIEQPKMLDKQPDIEYWLDKSRLGTKPQAIIRFTKNMLNTPLLESLSVGGRPNATNYKVTFQEWQKLHEIIYSAI